MSRLVLDCSVALTYAFDDEAIDDELNEQILDSGNQLLVPTLWDYEVANAILMSFRRGRIDQAEIRNCFAAISKLPVTRLELKSSPEDLIAVAVKSELTAYDAAYLLLAREQSARVLTFDSKLLKAAEAVGLQ